MAARVNTRFVVLLGAGLLVLVAGIAYLGREAIRKSGDDYVKLGDAAMAANKPSEAVGFYAKAVFKDQKNAGWIRKWMAAMEKDTPSGRAVYLETYQKQYMLALRSLPEADRGDVEAHRRYLDEVFSQYKLDQNVIPAMEAMIRSADELIKNYNGPEKEGKVLLRYRALPKMALLTRNPDNKPQDYAQTRKDLEDVLSADPKDADCVLSLAQIDLSLAARAKKQGETEEADKLLAAAKDRLRKFIADHPPASRARMALLLQEANTAKQESTKPISDAEILGDRKSEVQAVFDALKAEDLSKVDPGMVYTTLTYFQIAIAAEQARPQIDDLIDRILKAQPDNAAMLMSIARFDQSRNDTDRAVARLQTVVDMPDKPMSLNGYLLFGQKVDAILRQADVLIGQWEGEKDPAKREELVGRVKKLRADLVVRVGDAAQEVLGVDAKIAYISGDQRGARTLLTRYNDITGQKDTRALALLANLLASEGNTGAARQTYERLLTLEPGNPRTLFALADLETKSRNLEGALPYLEVLTKMYPDNKALKEQYQSVADALKKSPADSTPLSRRLKEIEDTANGVGADLPKAIQMAEDLLKTNKDDFRVYRALIYLYDKSGQRDKALESLDLAIKQFPDNQQLKDARVAMTGDPVQNRIDEIKNASNASPLEKAKAMYMVYKMAGQNDKAKAPFDEMVKLAPEDPVVVDYRFSEYAAANDSKGMGDMVALAEAKNLDQLGGLLFRARQQLVEKKYVEATQSLRSALDRDKLNQPAWRMLGQVLIGTNDFAGAAEAFGKAVEIRPADVPSINGLLRSEIMIGNQTEALAQARKSEKFAAGNPEFDELMLRLESEVAGGDKVKAATIRERIAKQDPNNKENKVRLIVLKLEQRKFDEARPMIDQLKADPDLQTRFTAAELEGQWFAAQGKLAEAEKVFDDYIASLPADKKDEMPYIVASGTLLRAGQPDRSLAYLEKGRAVESKQTMRITREMGDLQFNLGKAAEAGVEYKRVLDAGSPDPDGAVAKRLLECYLRTKEWAKFDEMIAAMGEKAQKDATLLLLAAQASLDQGDAARAAKLFDQAVAADPKNPIVFMKRGEFVQKDPAKERDAIADFEQAAKLAPGSTIPLKQIVILYKVHGKQEKAAETLRKALDLDPSDDTIRAELINLRIALKDEIAATALIDEAVKNKPDSIAWPMRAGKLMSELGRPEKAAEYYGKAWEMKKSLEVAIPYVTTLVAKTPADTATAWKIANDKVFAAAEEVPVRLLKAMVLQKSDQKADAYGELEKAYLKIDPADSSMVQLFSSGIESTYPDNNRDQLAAWGKLNTKKELTKWMYIFAQLTRLREESTRDKAAEDVLAYIAKQEDASMKLSVYTLMATYFYQVKDFARSAEMYKKVLENDPNNAEALNNVAFILASELKQPGEALKYAEKAAEISPKSANVLDTLGVCQLGLNDLENAEKSLTRAVDFSKSDNDRVPSLLHLAQVKKARGDRAGAKQVLQDVRGTLDSNPGLKRQHEKEFKELSDQIDSN